MSLIHTIAVLITLTALFSYVNHRYVRLPPIIGLMVLSLGFSVLLLGLGACGIGVERHARDLLDGIDFNKTVLHGMLSLLLFAGALHVDLNALARRGFVIGALATLGVVMSALIVAVMTWTGSRLLGIEIPFLYCLLFGALISPTDPIAVLGMLKKAKAPERLEIMISGESLFNDGVGVVLFSILFGMAVGGHGFDAGEVAVLFAEEVGGGLILGLVLGSITYHLLRGVDEYAVEILMTLALVVGGYALATSLHASGPITVVVAGLFIGNPGRRFAMSEETRRRLDEFWELIDEFLNAVLFVLIGLEVLILPFQLPYWMAGIIGIPLVLAARFLSIGALIAGLRRFGDMDPHTVKILTWAGLRGGISVAMALAIPPGPERELILTATYVIVVFSIVVQGLTIGRLVSWALADEARNESHERNEAD